MTFLRNVLSTFLAEAISVGLNFLVGVLVARLLSVSERGLLALVMLLPVTLAYLADVGVSQSIVYFLGRKQASLAAVLGVAMVLGLALSGLSAAILWLGRGLLLATVLNDIPPVYFGLALLLLPVLLLDSYGLSVLRAQQRFGRFNARRLLTPLLALLGVIGLVWWGGYGLPGAVAAFVFSYGVGLLVTAGLLAGDLAAGVVWQPALAWAALRFGSKSYLQNLVGHLNYRLDVYLLALFLPPAQVAYYAVATSVAEVAWYLPNSVGTVLFPRLAVESASEPASPEQAEQRVHMLTAEVTRHTLVATGVVTLLLLAVGWWLIPLVYGAAYRPAILPLLVLAPGILTMALYKVLTRNFTSRNRQQVSIFAAATALALNLALNWVLAPRWGAVGAAAASLVSYSVAALILLIVFRRQSGISLGGILLLRRADLARYRQAWQGVRRRAQEQGWLDSWLAG